MIYTDGSTVKIDSVILPGVFKSIEIKGDAIVDEQEVEGQSRKPKQATGYEDMKVNIELILEDGPGMGKLEKLETIQQLFRTPKQEKPAVHRLINSHTAARGVKQVIFKSLTHKAENKKGQILVTLEFWEYVAMTITASQSAGGAAGASEAARANLTADYQSYLAEGQRGKAPALQRSPAQDTAEAGRYLAAVKEMPY